VTSDHAGEPWRRPATGCNSPLSTAVVELAVPLTADDDATWPATDDGLDPPRAAAAAAGDEPPLAGAAGAGMRPATTLRVPTPSSWEKYLRPSALTSPSPDVKVLLVATHDDDDEDEDDADADGGGRSDVILNDDSRRSSSSAVSKPCSCRAGSTHVLTFDFSLFISCLHT